MKIVYDQFIINLMANEDVINKTEGVLFAESSVFQEDLVKFINKWNKNALNLEIKGGEMISIVEEEEFIEL